MTEKWPKNEVINFYTKEQPSVSARVSRQSHTTNIFSRKMRRRFSAKVSFFALIIYEDQNSEVDNSRRKHYVEQ